MKTIILKDIVQDLEEMEGMKEIILKRNPVNAINVEKSFHNGVISTFREEYILERNPINVNNAAKPFQNTVVSKHIKGLILERNC